MEHPYRIHSSIGFGFLQLLFISSIAYPSPPPPVYYNITVLRLMATVYFTIFQDKPFYLKLECLTILFEVIFDALYVQYIIRDYTYIFGVIDICSNILFLIFVVISLKNGNDTERNTKEISEKMENVRKTCVSCCFGLSPQSQLPTHEEPLRNLERMEHRSTNSRMNSHLYKSIPSDDYRKNTNYSDNHANQDDKAPAYTFGGRQAFKPSFYNSSWGREYIQSSVEREFDKIDKHNTELGDIGMISGTDGTTQYIRFDEYEPSSNTGISNYANIFVSPYFTKDGTQITGCTNIDKIGVCLFIYNMIQFIYQLMIYSSIIVSCREHNLIMNNSTTFQIEKWLC